MSVYVQVADLEGVKNVIVYPSANNQTRNCGFAYIDYKNHGMAAMALNKLSSDQIQLWGRKLDVEWANPVMEDMARVSVLQCDAGRVEVVVGVQVVGETTCDIHSLVCDIFESVVSAVANIFSGGRARENKLRLISVFLPHKEYLLALRILSFCSEACLACMT